MKTVRQRAQPQEPMVAAMQSTLPSSPKFRLPAQTNVFRRLDRLDRANYSQALALKRATLAAFSVDYTSFDGAQVLRGVVSADARRARVIDRVRFENYARVHPSRGYGYAVSAQRHICSALMAAGGSRTSTQDMER